MDFLRKRKGLIRLIVAAASARGGCLTRRNWPQLLREAPPAGRPPIRPRPWTRSNKFMPPHARRRSARLRDEGPRDFRGQAGAVAGRQGPVLPAGAATAGTVRSATGSPTAKPTSPSRATNTWATSGPTLRRGNSARSASAWSISTTVKPCRSSSSCSRGSFPLRLAAEEPPAPSHMDKAQVSRLIDLLKARIRGGEPRTAAAGETAATLLGKDPTVAALLHPKRERTVREEGLDQYTESADRLIGMHATRRGEVKEMLRPLPDGRAAQLGEGNRRSSLCARRSRRGCSD